jgi:hypothetical protein
MPEFVLAFASYTTSWGTTETLRRFPAASWVRSLKTIFRRLLPAARFKRSNADTEHVSLRAADLTAHTRLVLLKRHGDREAILLEAARSAPRFR